MMNSAVRTAWLCRWQVCLVLGCLGASCPSARGQDAEGAPLEFRRLYVPQNQQKNWPLDPAVRYGPMPKADFERLVELLRNSPPNAGTMLAARIGQAHYRAQLTGESDLAGQATLEIERPQSRALPSQTEDPGALMPLAPCNLAISSAQWSEGAPEDALCGVNSHGQWSVLVRRAGPLVLDWALRGVREPSGGYRYNFELPQTPGSSLSIDLPAQLTLKASRGVVVQATDAQDSLRRWQLTLGGQNRFWILVTPQDETRRNERGAMLRQASTYSVHPRGLELTAQFTLDVAQEPLRQLELTLDPGLRLLAARHGESHIPWSVIEDPASPSSRIVLEFSEPLVGLGNVILLGATAALKVDEMWRLPGIRASGINWQEGRATLLVPKPLSLERLNLTDCRQTNIGPLPPPASGESINVQYFEPDAEMEVRLAHGQQRLQVSTGTAIELTEDAIQGRVTAELSINEGQLFSLQAVVPHRWNIDDIVSEPPGRIKDWSLDTPTPRKRVLDVRLAKALSPSTPLRLIFSGHRLNVAGGETLPVEELRLIQFSDAAEGEHAAAVNCPETHQLQLSGGEEMKRYDPQKLSPAVLALFSPAPHGLMFRFDPRATRLGLTMQRLAPRYTADLRVAATVTAGPLLESYEIRCRPQGSRVERLFVYFSHAREEAPRWNLQGDISEPLSARRLTDEQMLAQCGRETGEMWELSLGRPSSASFTIEASRTVALGEDTPLSLIWLPGADSQEGQVQVRCPAEAAVNLRSSRLRPTPLETRSGSNLVRAQFRYSPALDTAAVDPAPISLSRDEQALTQSPAVVWQATLESRYEPAGSAQHTAAWFIEHTGQSYLSLKLPAEIQLDDVWVDEEQIVPRVVGDELTIPLAAGHRYPTVTVHFRTQEAPLGELSEFTAPFPASSLPVLTSDWTLWLPPGYSLAVRDGAWKQAGYAPRSLVERLLGPLARAGTARFEPLEAEAWRGLAQLPWDERHAQQAADQFLDNLGRTPLGTWGGMLLHLQPALELAQQTILVDHQSLWKAGVSPASVALGVEPESPRRRGLSRLEAAHLCLLVHGNTLLLTTPLATAELSNELVPLDHASLLRVSPGKLSQSLKEAVRQQGSSRYCLINQWVAEPLAPWRVPRSQSNDGIDTPGWGVFRLTGSATTTPRIEIVRQSTIQVFAWGLFLVIVTLCFRRFERPGRLVVLALAAACAALLVPEPYCPIFSSALLAFLAALTWQIAAPRVAPATRVTPSSYSYRLSDSVHTVATGVVLLLLVLIAARAMAGEGLAGADVPQQPRVDKVLIPVDDDQKPAGDLYWVPIDLNTRMQRRAARLALEPEGWLLERAEYRGTLAWDLAQQKLLVSELRARLDLTVFETSCRVKLPFARAEFTLTPPDRILVDGLEVPAQWEDEGRLLCIDAAQPGQFRVELLLRPVVNAYADQAGFDLSVPSLPTARLELQLPRSAPVVEVPTSAGPVTLADEGRRLLAQLGKANRLSVRWRDGAASAAQRTTVDADQLVWLKVQPGSVVAETRWKFKVLEGSIRQLQLAIDPRLQLQAPLETRNPLVAQSRLVAGNPTLLQIELARPVSDQFVLDAAFRWSGVSGIGNLRAPYLEAQQVRTLRRLLAITLDPLLEHKEPDGEGLTPLPAADFMQQWGTPDAPAQLAYRSTAEASRWSLAVRPKPVRRNVDSVLAVSLSAGRSTWRYDATVQIAGSCFEHRLQTPTTLNIDQIDVREDGVSRLSHWSRDAEGLVTLFLTEPASGPQLVELHGWTTVPQRGPWRLANLRFEEAEARSALVRVYRQPSVAVEVRNRNGLAEQTELKRQLENQLFEADRRYVGMGRLVSLMRAETPAYAATFLVSANQPRFDCRQTTFLKREAGDWQAELDCRIKVNSGLVDALYFDIPPAWRPPFVVTPAADYEVIQTGEGNRQLVVRPVAAIASEAELHVRGMLGLPAGSRLQMPAITTLFAEHLERSLVVPGQIDLQIVSWETRGLSRVESAPPVAQSVGLSDPQAFLVVDDAFSATLQPAARTPGQPQVALADISLSWQARGSVQGVATFDLEPSGNRECPLHLPAGYRLVQARVNGLPALAASEGDEQWRLSLASTELPQHIEIVFSGDLPPAAWGRQRLPAPTLGDLPVDRTLWTIRGPQGSKLVDVLEPRQTNVWRQHQFRLQSIIEMQRLAAGLSSEESAADLAAWSDPWTRRYRQYRGDAERELLQVREPDSASSVLAELRAMDQESARLTRELTGDTRVRPASADLEANQPGQLWRFAFDAPQPPVRAMFASRSAEIEVARGESLWDHWPWRLLTAMGISAVAAALLALARSRWWPAWQRWRYVASAALGLAWWLWLSPSLLGLVIVGLSAVAAWRDRPRPREAGSAVVRLGTSNH